MEKEVHPFKIFFLTTLASWMNREQSEIIEYLLTANDVLKKKLEAGGKRIKFTDTERARLARKGCRLSWKNLCRFSNLVTPETIIRWHKKFIAKKYDSSKSSKNTEARKRRETVCSLVCKIAKENPSWGFGKIVGALKHIGIRRSRTTVRRIMYSNGFDPKPDGEKTIVNNSWNRFIRTHLNLIMAADFFNQEVWTLRGLVRYMVFFLVDCASKKVKILHISSDFYEDKMTCLALGMTDYISGILKDKRYFFCDKDVLYTRKFRGILKSSGIEVRQVPSPVCNPYAERFVKSIKTECLNHLILFGENQLRHAVGEYENFYNSERPHQNLDNNLIMQDLSVSDTKKSPNPLEIPKNIERLIVKKERLGGLLNFYYRKSG